MHTFFSSDTFPKCCLVVSFIGTFDYNPPVSLVVFLHHQCLMATLAKILFFVSQIKNANLSGKFLVSYDLTSLFTNIHLQKTFDIAINVVFNHN